MPERPETIPGYIHPTTQSWGGGSIYKTFTEGKKARKKEKFGRTQMQDKYSLYGSGLPDNNICPTCRDVAISTCSCAYNDKRCSNGHIWYTRRDGKIKKGNPHK